MGAWEGHPLGAGVGGLSSAGEDDVESVTQSMWPKVGGGSSCHCTPHPQANPAQRWAQQTRNDCCGRQQFLTVRLKTSLPHIGGAAFVERSSCLGLPTLGSPSLPCVCSRGPLLLQSGLED